jgi:hypothetical protein
VGLLARLAALVLFVAIIAASVLLVRGILEDPASFGPLATVVGAVAAVVAERWYSRRQDLKAAHREELLPVYAFFVNSVRNLESEDGEVDPKFQQMLNDLHGALLLRGPPTVIQAYIDWWDSIPDPDEEIEDDDDRSLESFMKLEKVYRAIRADLGINDDDLPPGFLLRLHVNDIFDYMAAYVNRNGKLPA